MPPEMDYFYATASNQQRGPVSVERLRELNLPGETLVWREGMAEWQRLDSLPEFAASASPVASPTSPPPAASVAITPAPLPVYDSVPMSFAQVDPTLRTNGMAIASLVLGIASLVFILCYLIGFIPGVLAIIFGIIARKQIRRGEGQGLGMATAGLVCGSIAIGLIVVMFLFFFVMAMVGAFHK